MTAKESRFSFITEGVIVFDPEVKTKKHEKQSSWKKTGYILIDDDLCNYYSWFIKKRYNITLNTPIRRSHVTFLNDRSSDILNYEKVKNEWSGKIIRLQIELTLKTDGDYFWFNVTSEYLDNIRSELGLGKYYYPYHLTIGFSNEKNIEQSNYIHQLINKFGPETYGSYFKFLQKKV